MQISPIFLYITVALLGLAFGSFLNVCISRLPRAESVISPRSHCPKCGKPIRWYDNIPVVSYIFLRARCRDCHTGISPVYPAVEILTALVLVAALRRYELTPEFVKYAVLGMLLVVLIFTDLNERRIPHAVTLLGMSLGLLLSVIIPVDPQPLQFLFRYLGFFVTFPVSSFLGAVAGALVFFQGGRSRLFGVIIFTAALLYFFTFTLVIQPAFLPPKSSIDVHFEGFGHTTAEVLGSVLSRPGEVFWRIVHPCFGELLQTVRSFSVSAYSAHENRWRFDYSGCSHDLFAKIWRALFVFDCEDVCHASFKA